MSRFARLVVVLTTLPVLAIGGISAAGALEGEGAVLAQWGYCC